MAARKGLAGRSRPSDLYYLGQVVQKFYSSNPDAAERPRTNRERGAGGEQLDASARAAMASRDGLDGEWQGDRNPGPFTGDGRVCASASDAQWRYLQSPPPRGQSEAASHAPLMDGAAPLLIAST